MTQKEIYHPLLWPGTHQMYILFIANMKHLKNSSNFFNMYYFFMRRGLVLLNYVLTESGEYNAIMININIINIINIIIIIISSINSSSISSNNSIIFYHISVHFLLESQNRKGNPRLKKPSSYSSGY